MYVFTESNIALTTHIAKKSPPPYNCKMMGITINMYIGVVVTNVSDHTTSRHQRKG